MLVEQKPLSVRRDFKPMAERRENLPSKAALEDELEEARWVEEGDRRFLQLETVPSFI